MLIKYTNKKHEKILIWGQKIIMYNNACNFFVTNLIKYSLTFLYVVILCAGLISLCSFNFK